MSVADFGAKGDGRTDDTAASLRAVREAYESATEKRPVELKIAATDAFYKTTRAIDIRSDVHHPVHIVGEGEKSFIKNTARSGGHEFAPVFRPGLLVAGGRERSAPGQDYYPILPAQKGAEFIKFRSARPPGLKAGAMPLIAGGPRQYHGNAKVNWFLRSHRSRW